VSRKDATPTGKTEGIAGSRNKVWGEKKKVNGIHLEKGRHLLSGVAYGGKEGGGSKSVAEALDKKGGLDSVFPSPKGEGRSLLRKAEETLPRQIEMQIRNYSGYTERVWREGLERGIQSKRGRFQGFQ